MPKAVEGNPKIRGLVHWARGRKGPWHPPGGVCAVRCLERGHALPPRVLAELVKWERPKLVAARGLGVWGGGGTGRTACEQWSGQAASGQAGCRRPSKDGWVLQSTAPDKVHGTERRFWLNVLAGLVKGERPKLLAARDRGGGQGRGQGRGRGPGLGTKGRVGAWVGVGVGARVRDTGQGRGQGRGAGTTAGVGVGGGWPF
jgi:hypothetical protein